MKPEVYRFFCEEFMDIQRERREGKLPLDEALDSYNDLEVEIAKQIAKERLQ